MKNSTISQEPTKQFVRKDIHQQVTDTIIQQLEAGVVPWQQPWTGTNSGLPPLPKNFTTGNRYRGINILLLWSSAISNEFTSSEWATFKQWSEKKEMVRKGEKGSLIVYYDTFEKQVDDEIKKIPFLKSSIVFNKCQLANYEPVTEELPRNNLTEKVYQMDEFISNTKAEILHHDKGAYYHRLEDKIFMPHPEYFVDTDNCTATEGYYSTKTHELIHWTGSTERLNRTKGKKFGDSQYAYEELVAELGAAFQCSLFGITTIEKPNHASYIASWLKFLKDNKECLISASSEASKAVDYLYSLQP